MRKRRDRTQLDSDVLRKDVEARLEGTPLAPIGVLLQKLIAGTSGSDGTWQSRQSQTALWHVRSLLDRLPVEFGARFIFDSLLIKAIATSWSACPHPLSDAIVPTYGAEWRLDRQPIYPGPATDQIHMLELLVIRGVNKPDDVDLTEYAWLVHEMLHSIFYRNEKQVHDALMEYLGPVLRDLRAGALPGRRADAEDRIVRYWTPRSDHFDWSHELLIDLVGFAVAGPAYARNFLADTEGAAHEPYKLEQSHPPLAVRIEAIEMGAQSHGWADAANELARRREHWVEAGSSRAITNAYRSAAAPALVQAVIDAASRLMKLLRLPVWTAPAEQRARTKMEVDEIPDLGIELLSAAWQVRDTMDEAAHRTWNKKVVAHFAE